MNSAQIIDFLHVQLELMRLIKLALKKDILIQSVLKRLNKYNANLSPRRLHLILLHKGKLFSCRGKLLDGDENVLFKLKKTRRKRERREHFLLATLRKTPEFKVQKGRGEESGQWA